MREGAGRMFVGREEGGREGREGRESWRKQERESTNCSEGYTFLQVGICEC